MGQGRARFGVAGLVVLLGLAFALPLAVLQGGTASSVTHAATAAPPGGDWTSYTHDAADSRYQSASTVTSDNVASLAPAWSFRTGNDVTSTPAVLDGIVYFGDWGGNVYALNIADGSLVWKVNVGSAVSSTPLLYHGRVYVGIGPNFSTQVAALSQKTGETIWRTTLHGTVHGLWASPTVFDNTIYIGMAAANGEPQDDRNASGEMFALDATTGKIKWKYTTAGTAGGAGVWGTVVADPALDAIYFGAGNAYGYPGTTNNAYSIVSLNATTGELNWSFHAYPSIVTGGDFDFGATPSLYSIVAAGKVHSVVGIGSKDGNYYIVDRTTGALLHKYAIGDAGANLGIIGAAGFVDDPSDANNPEVFIAGRKASHGVVDALLPSKRTIAWRAKLDGEAFGADVIVPGAVLVGDTDGNIYALSTADGTVLKKLTLPALNVGGTPTPTGIYGGTTVAEGHVIVPAGYGAKRASGIYAFAPAA